MIVSRFSQLAAADYALADETLARCLSPALVVYVERVRDNLRRILRHAGGDASRWRPHIKTVKIPEVLAELADVGLRNFKCATTREAAWLLRTLDERGIDGADLLVAYPLAAAALARLADIARRRPRSRVSVVCEDSAALGELPEPLSVFIDVNPGMNRTGVPAADEATIVEIARRAGRRFRGLHFYDGHVHGADAAARRLMAHSGYDRLTALVRRLRGVGIEVGEIVTSGTPSFLYALDYPGFGELTGTIHRVSPGTVVYHDLRSEQELEDLELSPAALVLGRVVSHPSAGIVTCDAGSKSIAAEAGDPSAFALGYPRLEALSPSEEHLPLRVHGGAPPPRGAPLMLIPRHVCPTVNLAERALLVDADGHAEVVAVRARAHDLLVDDDPI